MTGHIDILYGVYGHLNMTPQLPLNNECRSRLIKTIYGNHVDWPPQGRSRKARNRSRTVQ